MARRDTRPLADVRFERQSAMRSRRTRTPTHPFRVEVRPWQIVPTMFAPVLPGDTVKGYQFQARVLTDPLKDRLAGWWCEYFTFYVKVSDLPEVERTDMKEMLIGASAITDTHPTGSAPYYTGKGSYGILGTIYSRIVCSYFRDEASLPAGQDYDTDPFPPIGSYSAAKINSAAWWDSVALDAEVGQAGGTTDDADWDQLWAAYQNMRNAKLTQATWPEYLAMQGVSTPPQLEEPKEFRRPELIRFQRDFQYPVQVVEPSTGKPAALVQWAMADRLQRARFCAEPGWLVGLLVIRPKAYLRNQAGNATAWVMNEPAAWMPSALDSDPHARLQLFQGDPTDVNPTGPVKLAHSDYWIDPGDLLNRGDQFHNIADLTANTVAVNSVALPVIGDGTAGSVNMMVPSSADADGVFAGADKLIHVDGVYSLQIASRGGGTDATGRRGSW